MKKFIIITGIFTAIFIISCNQHQSPQQSAIATDTPLITSWEVKGCAEKASSPDTKFPPSGEFTDYPDLPLPGTDGIKAEADSIVYSRNVSHLCCREVKVTVERTDNRISITEYWYRQGCKCKCSSTVRAVIRQLPKGDYRILAIETGTDPVDDKPAGGRDTVMNQMITIR